MERPPSIEFEVTIIIGVEACNAYLAYLWCYQFIRESAVASGAKTPRSPSLPPTSSLARATTFEHYLVRSKLVMSDHDLRSALRAGTMYTRRRATPLSLRIPIDRLPARCPKRSSSGLNGENEKHCS
jgi:hypothetical protein